MRTNIVIDDSLLEAAQQARPNATKRALVEEGLQLLVTLEKQKGIRKLRGKVKWEGDLEAMRLD